MDGEGQLVLLVALVAPFEDGGGRVEAVGRLVVLEGDNVLLREHLTIDIGVGLRLRVSIMIIMKY